MTFTIWTSMGTWTSQTAPGMVTNAMFVFTLLDSVTLEPTDDPPTNELITEAENEKLSGVKLH